MATDSINDTLDRLIAIASDSAVFNRVFAVLNGESASSAERLSILSSTCKLRMSLSAGVGPSFGNCGDGELAAIAAVAEFGRRNQSEFRDLLESWAREAGFSSLDNCYESFLIQKATNSPSQVSSAIAWLFEWRGLLIPAAVVLFVWLISTRDDGKKEEEQVVAKPPIARLRPEKLPAKTAQESAKIEKPVAAVAGPVEYPEPVREIIKQPPPIVMPRPKPKPSPLALPETAYVKVYEQGQERVAPLSITASSDRNYYVKLKKRFNGTDVLGIFIRAGTTAEVDVPLGLFTLVYACGTDWYGEGKYFGEDGTCFKADEDFHFHQEGQRVRGYEITLFPVVNGNLETTEIKKSEF